MGQQAINLAISKDGAFSSDDADIGRMVETFADKNYPFQTEEGLTFLQTVLNDNRVREVVRSSLERPGLGMFKVFGPHPRTARALLNRTTDEMLALNVLLCRSRSRVILHEGSQKYELDAKPGGTGLLELPREAMDAPGIQAEEVLMNEGGLIITDGRLFTTVLEGVGIAVGFAAEKELEEWGKMPWPESLEKIVAEMETDVIKMNFKFVEDRRSR
ncbi:uncharacterized protein VDAG_04871 [Verticillium dahliae VdLs.17]|uniref:Uncharacterized protein n=1 Tax=Verticillium dahliae (strain VdLs.17 / ATCC MYA-4575 / FGSC 10137) TaxID=498257 RepID=G2X386_VERDV|nr:uncharacterized protein VDAG_04871 [Verticillium dahliae VdLs.17]EGY23433.1 hypothetical protein VDAG_04871 [Verticillium dahliae VdLs.17]